MSTDVLEVISLANTLSTVSGVGMRVSSLRQCNAHFFSRLLASLTGTQLTPLSTESSRCQAVVDALSNHLSPHVNLEHIKGSDLAGQDLPSIKNLLDIFSVLFGRPPPVSCRSDRHKEEDGNDSNLISSEGFSVISEVLREELGDDTSYVTQAQSTQAHRSRLTQAHSSHSTTDTDSTTELLRPVPRATLPSSITTPVSMATATSEQPVTSSSGSQTTPTQSPSRRRQLLQSPLHHSTPHVSTRSRVFQSSTSHPHTPQVLTYPHTPHQPHTLTDVSSTVLPDSTHSTAVLDLTITELHTTHNSTPSPEREHPPHSTPSPEREHPPHSMPSPEREHPPHSTPSPEREHPPHSTPSPEREHPPHRVKFTDYREGHSIESGGGRSPTQQPPPVTNLPSDPNMTAHAPPTPTSPLTQSHPPLTPSHHSDTDETSAVEAGQLNKSRDDVLAALYKNYLGKLSREGKGRRSKSSKVTTVHRKNKRSKAHLYHRYQKRAKTPPPSPESSEDEQTPGTPTEFAVGDDLLPLVGREFPFLHVSPSMLRVMWQKQVAQVQALTKQGVGQKGRVLNTRVREMERRHDALLNLIHKEVEHTQRMRRTQEQRSQKQAVLSSVRSKRQSAARARRYFYDYELRLRAKFQRERTREEQIFKRAFEGGLKLQRERVREVKKFVKEKEEASTREHHNKLEAMENFYRDQFAILTEAMITEKNNTTLREKAQIKLARGLRRELRGKMEGEIIELQDCLERDHDVAHFRKLDELQLQHKLANLTFTSNPH